MSSVSPHTALRPLDDQDGSETKGQPPTETPAGLDAPQAGSSRGSRQPATEFLRRSTIELNSLPREYLEAYPYPAFVLTCAVPPSDKQLSVTDAAHLPWTMTSLPDQPFSPVWSNRSWRRLGRNQILSECLSLESLQRLGAWIVNPYTNDPDPEGVYAQSSRPVEPERLKGLGIKLTDKSHDITSPTGRHGNSDRPLPPTITLQFRFGSTKGTFELTKSSMPINLHHDNGRAIVTTHTFAVITAIPRDDSALRARRDTPTMTPPTPHSGQLSPKLTATPAPDTPRRPMRKMVLDNKHPDGPVSLLVPVSPHMELSQAVGTFEAVKWGDAQALVFNRDGTVQHSQPTPTAKAPDGRPLAVNALVDYIDWSQTPLGPREQWTNSLKSQAASLVAYPLNGVLWWGPEFTMMYNQRFADTVALNHPQGFGISGTSAWMDIWTSLGPLTDVVVKGTPVFRHDVFQLAQQKLSGVLRESYRHHLWMPVRDDDGSQGGLFHGQMDVTKHVISERRTTLVKVLSERTGSGRTVAEFHDSILETLQDHPKDAPFALLYDIHRTVDPGYLVHRRSSASTHNSDEPQSHVQLRYAGGVGIPDNHPSAPQMVDLLLPSSRDQTNAMLAQTFSDPTLQHSTGDSTPSRSATCAETPTLLAEGKSDQWPFLDALISGRCVIVEDCISLIQGYPVRVWDELASSAVVIPLNSNRDKDFPTAILILGLSCRLDFDEDYEAFIHLLRFQMSIHLSAMQSIQDDKDHIEELGKLDRAKSTLFSNVSHELITPLSLIAGPLDDVLMDTPSGPKRDSLMMARGNVRRLTRLVNILMDVSNLEAGRLKGTFSQINLGIVTRDVAGLFRKGAEAAKLEFIVTCDIKLHDVYVDRERWEKILFNLIGNAITYTAEGSVHVSLAYSPTDAVLTVADTGVGIPSCDLGLVGHQFYRGHTQVHDGTGIALTFTKKLIEMHDGTLEIESKTTDESADGSHGSTFRVRIPLGRSHLPADAIDTSRGDVSPHPQGPSMEEYTEWHSEWESTAEGTSESSAPTATETLAKYRGIDPSTLWFKQEDVIMVVDDLPDTRRYLRSLFEPFCKVVEAKDGHSALHMFDETKPDLIIADVMMRRMSGFALLSALRSGTREQQVVPFIMLTASDDTRPEGAFGADDYLSKPFNARELIARVHMQLQLGKKRRALEDLFDERASELRLLTDLSPVGIFRCTYDGYVSYANAAWYEMSGYPANLPVTNWGDYIREDHQARVRAIWEAYIPSGEATVEAEWQWSNDRWMSVKVIRLDSEKGDAGIPKRGFVGCSVDITERKLNEEMQRQRIVDAEQRRAEAEEAKAQQELLIDVTSHEIRNPISSLMQISRPEMSMWLTKYCSSLVRSNLLVLQEQLKQAMEDSRPFEPTVQLLATIAEDLEALDSIYQCGLTQERISNDVLSLGKIQLDMLQMFDVQIDVRNEAQKIIAVFQNEARMKRISLSLHILESFESLGITNIMTDPVRLGQILTNLLSNAIRFTAASKTRRIELRLDIGLQPPEDGTCTKPLAMPVSPLEVTEQTDIYVFVSVSDTGPGMTDTELATLFQRFSQASAKTHTLFGGSGLGLFVCRQLTELMGGRIEVVSEHGKGSQFRFFIRTHPSWNTAKEESRVTHETPRNLLTLKPRVLVVEDNIINRTVLLRQLKHVGFEVESACNGLEAVTMVRRAMTVDPRVPHSPLHDTADKWSFGEEEPPAEELLPTAPYDCVLMDLEMPVMDGYASARRIRAAEAQGKLYHSNIIALTGNARQVQIDEAMVDFTDVVVKPYRLDDLLHKIEDIMGRHQEEVVAEDPKPRRPMLTKR